MTESLNQRARKPTIMGRILLSPRGAARAPYSPYCCPVEKMRNKLHGCQVDVCSTLNSVEMNQSLRGRKQRHGNHVENLLFAPNSGNACDNLHPELRLLDTAEQHRTDCHDSGAVWEQHANDGQGDLTTMIRLGRLSQRQKFRSEVSTWHCTQFAKRRQA
jgi:hypothetical protein